jgi:hypothetical protein
MKLVHVFVIGTICATASAVSIFTEYDFLAYNFLLPYRQARSFAFEFGTIDQLGKFSPNTRVPMIRLVCAYCTTISTYVMVQHGTYSWIVFVHYNMPSPCRLLTSCIDKIRRRSKS